MNAQPLEPLNPGDFGSGRASSEGPDDPSTRHFNGGERPQTRSERTEPPELSGLIKRLQRIDELDTAFSKSSSRRTPVHRNRVLISARKRSITSPRLSYGRHRGPARFDSRRAAVVIAIYPSRETGQLCVTLTRRPTTLSHHGGQICLPGGKIEEGESPIEAALREYEEELGIPIQSPRLLGKLQPVYVFGSDNWVDAMVVLGEQPSKAPRPDPVEVEEVIEMPLRQLWQLGRNLSDSTLNQKNLDHASDQVTKNGRLTSVSETDEDFSVAFLCRKRIKEGKTCSGELGVNRFEFGYTAISFISVDGKVTELWGATAMLLEEFAILLFGESGVA